MAQKTGKEETEFKVVAETLTLCINKCGFTGSPATKNMCQKCFNAISSSPSPSSSSAGILTSHMYSGDKSIRSTSSTSPSRPIFTAEKSRAVEIPDRTATVVLEVSTTTIFKKKEVNRCSGCRKRVGLTGFRCRCGDLFCSEHRYSDRHECSYDYKAAGREAIARENPIVKAAKIVRV